MAASVLWVELRDVPGCPRRLVQLPLADMATVGDVLVRAAEAFELAATRLVVVDARVESEGQAATVLVEGNAQATPVAVTISTAVPPAPVDAAAVRAFIAGLRVANVLPLVDEDRGCRYEYGGGPHVAEPEVLALADGVRWLESAAPSRLYVRPAYRVLLMLSMAFLDQRDAVHQVLITGSFGVGKTAFLSFVLWQLRLAADPPTVVLDVDGFFGRIGADGAVEVGERGRSFADDLAERSTVYLCDVSAASATGGPLCGPNVLARTIVTAAPVHKLVAEFEGCADRRTVTFVMPLWTTAELETCRAACVPHVPREHLIELVHMWGGTARAALGTRFADAKEQFVRSAAALPLGVAAQLVRDHGTATENMVDADGYSEAGHRLVHMDVDADNLFKLQSVALCSANACAIVLNTAGDDEVGKLIETLEADLKHPTDRITEPFKRQLEHEHLSKVVRA